MEIINNIDGNKATMEIIGWLDTQTAPQLGEELSKLSDDIQALYLIFQSLNTFPRLVCVR